MPQLCMPARNIKSADANHPSTMSELSFRELNTLGKKCGRPWGRPAAANPVWGRGGWSPSTLLRGSLLLFALSHKSACLTAIIDVCLGGLLRHASLQFTRDLWGVLWGINDAP